MKAFPVSALMFVIVTGPTIASEPRDLATMIYSVDAQGNKEGACAAGIIISQTNERTIILTAHHVLEEIENAGASYTARVEFYGQRGHLYPVEVFSSNGLRDAFADYAVITVDSGAVPKLAAEDFAILGALDTSKGETKFVRAIGNSNCTPWDRDPNLQGVIKSSPFSIEYESLAAPGASGGPLFSADGDLVGMVIRADGRRAVARPLPPILEAIAQENVEISLRARPTAAALPGQETRSAPTAARSIAASLTKKDFQLSVLTSNGQETEFTIALPGKAKAQLASTTGIKAYNSSNKLWFRIPTPRIEDTPNQIAFNFKDGSQFGPIDLPIASTFKAFIDESVRSSTNLVTCRDVCTISNKSSQEVPRLLRWELGFDGTHFEYMLYGGWAWGGTPPPADQTNPIGIDGNIGIIPPSEAKAFYYRVVFLDGTVSSVMSVPIAWKQCYVVACKNALIPLQSSQSTAPPVLGSLRTGGTAWSQYDVLSITSAASLTNLEADTDGKGFLPASPYNIPWPKSDILKIRYRQGDKIVGPFSYKVPKEAIIRGEATLLAENAVTCVLQSQGKEINRCYLPSLLQTAHIRSIRYGFAYEGALSELRVQPPGVKLFDDTYRNHLRDCNLQACPTEYAKLNAQFAIPKTATDLYYQVEYVDGHKSDLIRRPLVP